MSYNDYRTEKKKRYANGAHLFLVGLAAVIAIVAVIGVMEIFFSKDCSGYLKRAADANTVERAKGEMDIALDYLETHKLTAGYTSVIYNTPDEDIDFWYTNLKEATAELDAVSKNPTTTALERSNVLMKLRETLLDTKGSGDKLTVPDGLSRYPYNGAFGFAITLSLLLALGGYVITENNK